MLSTLTHPAGNTPSLSLFPVNLRYLRKRRGLNQEDISALFNKKANTVGNWENGKAEPSIPELLIISGYFGVNLEDLLRSELKPQQPENELQLALWPAPAEFRAPRKQESSKAISVAREEIPGAKNNELANNNGTDKSETTDDAPEHPAEDAVWFMLRELRTVQERLDRLQTALEQPKPGQPADKSDH